MLRPQSNVSNLDSNILVLTQMINWSFVLQPQNIFDRPRLRLTITTVGVRMRVLYRILKALAD